MRKMLKAMLAPARRAAARFVGYAPPAPTFEETIFWKAGMILAAEKVEGDYLEFGVFTGRSMAQAYHVLRDRYAVQARVHEGRTPEDAAAVARLWAGMRFFAFDSFAGLPTLAATDAGTDDFQAGMYACSEPQFLANLAAAGVPRERVVTVPGWYDDSCVPATRERLGMRAAALVHIDCDLYSSALTALRFVAPLLQDGTVIAFDDWYSYKGHPARGEMGAFAQFQAEHPAWVFTEYQKEGAWRNSFLANRR